MYCTYAKYQHLKMFQMFCPTPGDMLVPYQFEPELSADSASQVDAAHGVHVCRVVWDTCSGAFVARIVHQ